MAESQTGRRFGTEELKDAGASEAFVSMYLSAAPSRHQLRNKLNGHAGDVLERGGDVTRATGGFFTKIWNGDLFDAFLNADKVNRPLMLEVFGPEKIRNQAVDEAGYGIEYATKMVNERASRHGYDEI